MRIVIANFSRPIPSRRNFRRLWSRAELPPARPRLTLFEQPVDWGFHVYAIGVHLMDLGIAERVEFWDYEPKRTMSLLANGVLKVTFLNEKDVAAYLSRFGPPDLFINYGVNGIPVLRLLETQTFRVHVPCFGTSHDGLLADAECFLLDAEEQLVERSMLYVPVVHTVKIRPGIAPKERDFIYLASCYGGKRHDLLVNAVRGTELTGHLHPVGRSQVDLSNTQITTSDHDERDVVELLQTSRDRAPDSEGPRLLLTSTMPAVALHRAATLRSAPGFPSSLGGATRSPLMRRQDRRTKQRAGSQREHGGPAASAGEFLQPSDTPNACVRFRARGERNVGRCCVKWRQPGRRRRPSATQ